MNIWFTSDTHYYHKNVITYCDRPYNSVEEMNEDLIAKWNEVVKPNDVVYHLGDFSMAFRPVETITPRLMGDKKLVPGNHDFCHPYHKRSRKTEGRRKWKKMYCENGWDVLPCQYTMEVGKHTVNMCHHPYKGDVPHDKGNHDKYWKYRLKNDGNFLLCGHVHEKWAIKDNMVNVGVDVNGMRPFHYDEVKALLDALS